MPKNSKIIALAFLVQVLLPSSAPNRRGNVETQRTRWLSRVNPMGGSPLAYNFGNQWRRLVLPKRIEAWSLTSLQQRLFGQMLRRIDALPVVSR